MFKLSDYFHVYREEENPDAPGAGGNEPKTFTAEEVAAMLEEKTSGLKSKLDELLTEKKTEAQKRKEAEEEKRRLLQDNLKKEGQFEEFEKNIRGEYAPQLEQRDGKIAKLAEKILGSERKSVIGSVLAKGKFIDPDAADLLTPFIRTEFDGEDVTTKFVGADGSVITTDPEKFVEWCRNHKVISHLMQADGPSGGGAGGSKGGGAAKQFSEMNDAERIELRNQNPAEFDRQMKLLRGNK